MVIDESRMMSPVEYVNSGIHQLKANLILLMDRTGEELCEQRFQGKTLIYVLLVVIRKSQEPKETKSNQLQDYVCAQSLIENGNP